MVNNSGGVGSGRLVWSAPASNLNSTSSERPTEPAKAAAPLFSAKQLRAQRSRVLCNAQMGPFDSSAPSRAVSRISTDQSVCANINDPQWHPVNAELGSFVRARMQKNLAQDLYFGEEHRKQAGGSCFGMNAVWRRLHHAQPDAPAAKRMALLMSKNGTTHAVNAQKNYKTKLSNRTQVHSIDMVRGKMTRAKVEETAINDAELYATHATLVTDEPFCDEDDYRKLGMLLKAPL